MSAKMHNVTRMELKYGSAMSGLTEHIIAQPSDEDSKELLLRVESARSNKGIVSKFRSAMKSLRRKRAGAKDKPMNIDARELAEMLEQAGADEWAAQAAACDVLDGVAFSAHIEYDDGSVYDARGMGMFPEGFSGLVNKLNKLAGR